jgi:hypothetical protein
VGEHKLAGGGQHRRLGGYFSEVGCYNVGVMARPIFYLISYVTIKGWLSIIPRRRVWGAHRTSRAARSARQRGTVARVRRHCAALQRGWRE